MGDAPASGSASASGSAGRTASLLLLLQLGSRIVTFSLNQALLAYTTPSAFGTATIQLEPLLNTVLFLSREGIRSALARTSSPSSSVARISLLPLALGTPLALAFFGFYAHRVGLDVASQPCFNYAVAAYALATIVELASEPWFNEAQVAGNVKLRVGVEGSAVIARALVTLLVVVQGKEKAALLAFGLGQLAYASTLLARYAWHFQRHMPKLVRGAAKGQKETATASDSKNVLQLAYALTKQSAFKQVLTEGDKVVVSRISPIKDQGGYALALNYGSLVARIVFQPLEESSRLYYSRNIGQPEIRRSPKAKEASHGDADVGLASSLHLLRQLIRLHLHLSLIFIFFCPFYVRPLLSLFLRSSAWSSSSASSLLRTYLFLLPLLGLNGLLEAFVQAVASEAELGKMSYALLGCSAVYAATCALGVRGAGMQEEALIWANAASMLGRIAYAASFVQRFCAERCASADLWQPVRDAKWTIVACALVAPLMKYSEAAMTSRTIAALGKHVAVGMVCFIPCAGIALYSERETLRALLQRRPKQKMT